LPPTATACHAGADGTAVCGTRHGTARGQLARPEGDGRECGFRPRRPISSSWAARTIRPTSGMRKAVGTPRRYSMAPASQPWPCRRRYLPVRRPGRWHHPAHLRDDEPRRRPVSSGTRGGDGAGLFARRHGSPLRGRDRTLRLWQVPTRKVLQSFTGITERVTAVAYAPTAATSWPATARCRLWDVRVPQPVGTSPAHAGVWRGVLTGSPSSDSAGADGTVRVWDATTGRELRRLEVQR